MELEWDEEKRLQALVGRGLDFADVARIDPASLITVPDLRRDYGERRYNSYGYLDGVLCIYCFTWRSQRMRIISMRRANARERKKYQAGTL